MRNSVLVAFCLLVNGCTPTFSSGILPAGPDTYIVTERYAPELGGSARAQKVALNEANDFCVKVNHVFLPTAMNTLQGLADPSTQTGYTVTFKCLLAGDPNIAKFQLERGPTVIVEQHNR